MNNNDWSIRIREGTAVRDTIELGQPPADAQGYYAEQAWVWGTIAQLAQVRAKEAKKRAKNSSVLERERERKIAEVRLFMEHMNIPTKKIEQTINRLRKTNESSEVWAPFRDALTPEHKRAYQSSKEQL